MSSTVTFEKCPQCKGIMVVDFNLRTYEESSLCFRCGYTFNNELVRDHKGQVVFDKHGCFNHTSTKQEGFGAYCINYRDSFGAEIGTLSEPISDETLEKFKEIFSLPNINMEDSYLVSYQDGEAKLLLGSDNDNLLDYEETEYASAM